MSGVYEYGQEYTAAPELEYATITLRQPDGSEVDGSEALALDQAGVWTVHTTDGTDVEVDAFYVRPPVLEQGS
jgi:hypothetical protein